MLRHSGPEIEQYVERATKLSTANSRVNNPWGDERQQKTAAITRVYAINLNGLQLDAKGGKFDSVCRSIKEIQADVFCGQEHNVDTTQASVRKIMFDTAHQHWERSRLVMGTSPIPFQTQFKPGGTMVMTVGSLTGRLCKQERDKWGRWSSQVYQGQAGRNIAVISAYQPIVKGGVAGKITVAAQHVSLLLNSEDDVTNPRVAFRRDLSKWLTDYQSRGYELLLVGDFNEPLGTDPDGMSKLAGDHQLMDVMAIRHSSTPPATYARGSKRLDYALASPTVCNALIHAGYDAFNTEIATDHRGYFMDFDTELLFGSETQKLVNRTKRELSTRNHKQVTAYIRRKHELLTKCNAFERSTRLLIPGNRHMFAERIDQDVLDASLNAERDLPKFFEPAWSVDLAQARRKKIILTKQLTALKTGLNHQEVLRCDIAKLDTSFNLPDTIQTCSHAMRVTDKEIKDLIATSTERRDQEFQRKITHLENSIEAADHKTAIKLRRIKKAEDINNMFRKLANVRKKQVRQGVTRVEIPRLEGEDPKACTDWVQIDVPTEVLHKLQQRNRAHFGQAFGTPFTIPPLATDLGFDGATAQGQQILDGEYDSTALAGNVQSLLSHLEKVQDIYQNPSKPTITEAEFRGKLRVWTESTTTSPSGLHLGHFKALIARHSYTTDAFDDELTEEFKQQRDELDLKQKELFELHLHMLNYALQRGYSYSRWKTIANTILFKDPDNVRLHRTRVIHIYEADFNLALGVKWREAMHKAEDSNSLNDGQYGSRAARSAPDPVFIEELQCEISRATRKPVILTNYDATACYDRIIPNVGMIASRKYGVPLEVTQTNALTLETAEYRIRTELGLAPTGYRHEETFPIYGTGQGSANSPAIWCMLSSALLDGYDQVAAPASYVGSSENPTEVKLGMISFVDDCNGQTNKFASDGSTETVEQLFTQTQKNAQEWSDLLTASGGALELSKCSSHVMQWKFSSQGAPVLVPSHEAFQNILQVTDRQTNEVQNLKVLSVYDAHKTLGHYKAPIGNQMEQFRQLKRKSDDAVAFLWTCPLTKLEAWTYYYACYLPSVGYPLACSSLKKKQLEMIQRQAMTIIVARCGYNRNTKKEILYGPLELGGANFRHLYVQQGVGQVIMFVRHWRLQSTAGKLLRVALSWFQQQTGVSYSILEHVHSALPHLESKWIGSLREFLAETNMFLQVDVPSIPKLQRRYDYHLMDAILDSKQFTNAEIRRLNYCRLYLQAVTLADITVITGDYLDKTKWTGTTSLVSSRTHGNVIYQERPSLLEWQLWKRMCKTLWSDTDGKLREPLGPWILPTPQQRQQHQAYFEHEELCGSDTILWVRIQGETYTRCIQTASPWVYRETTQYRTWENVPSHAAPSAVELIAPTLWNLTNSAATDFPETRVRPAATFDAYVSQLSPWEAELLQQVDLSEDPFTVSDVLSHGVCAVSDGSVWTDNQGSYGWMISSDLGDRVARGMGPARGAKVDSYRAEAYGMLAILCFLRRLSEFTTQMEPWSGILATDSQSLLETITVKPMDEATDGTLYTTLKRVKDLDVKGPEWDLLSSILTELHRCPGITLQYVRGHQDRKTAYERLPLLAQLNVDADLMATTYQCENGMSRPVVLLTETAGVHLVTPNGSTTKNYETSIRYQATQPGLAKYIQERYGWSTKAMNNVNWSAHGACLRRNIKRKTHYTKLVHGILPTCKNIHRGDQLRNKCPLCHTAVEDWSHILKCTHDSRATWRVQTVTAVVEKCDSLRTRPLLKRVLRDALTGWLTHDTDDYILDFSNYPSDVHRLIKQQNELGWQQLFLGRFSNEWSDLQDTFYAQKAAENAHTKKKTKKQTGHRWQVAMIGLLWEQWWVVWESRNKDLHGADERSRVQAETRELQRKLRELYDLKAQLSTAVQDLMYEEVTEHYDRPNWVNKNWIAIHEPVIKADLKRVATRIRAGTRSIRQFLISLVP